MIERNTMKYNLEHKPKLKNKFEKYGFKDLEAYPELDNYPGVIEVPFTDCIPIDYEGIMAVPITFLDKVKKFNTPDAWFNLLGCSAKYDNYAKQIHNDKYKEFRPVLNGKVLYYRLFIEWKWNGDYEEEEELSPEELEAYIQLANELYMAQHR